MLSEGGEDGNLELGSAKFSMKDFRAEYVTRKAFNVPLVGQDCYLRTVVCMDSTPHMVNVSRITLKYQDGVSRIILFGSY